MRKIFAVLLAVVMVACVFAALPASAAPLDSTTASDIPALIATEVAPNVGKTTSSSGRYYEYIEFYNRSDEPVNLYQYALARAPYYKSQPLENSSYYNKWDMWQTQHTFQSKVAIEAGPLNANADYSERIESLNDTYGVSWNNPASGVVAPHSFAILWVVSSQSLTAVENEAPNLLEPDPDLPRTMFRQRFPNMPNDVPIFYVWGDTAITSRGNVYKTQFDLEDCRDAYAGFMYGLVDITFNVDENKAYENGSFSNMVKVLFAYGANGDMHHGNTETKNTSAIYVPADQKPELQNRKNLSNSDNYVQGGYADTYLQVGMAHTLEGNTPGTMEAHQWYMVDAENAPAAIQGEDPEWGPKALNEWAERYYPSEDDSDWEGREEEELEYKWVTQEELQEKFFGPKDKNDGRTVDSDKKEDETGSEGLPTGALIGIIAGGVVLAVAIVVAVLIVVKKKKAAPAVEVPIEDAPVDESSAEDNKEE